MSDKAGHDQGLGGRRLGDQQTDFRSGDAAGVGRGSLRQDLTFGDVTQSHLCNCADVQATAANVDIRDALTLARHIRDFDALGAQALGHPNLPAAPYLAPPGRQLGEDFSFRHGGTVILAFDVDLQSALLGDHASCGRSMAHQVRDRDFMAVDCQAHGSKR